jgi:hypothetical protein
MGRGRGNSHARAESLALSPTAISFQNLSWGHIPYSEIPLGSSRIAYKRRSTLGIYHPSLELRKFVLELSDKS